MSENIPKPVNRAVYFSQFLSPQNMQEAKELSFEQQKDAENDYFDSDAKWICEQIMKSQQVKESQLVVDFGCGVGRIAKLLCQENINVIGVDASEQMCNYAVEYVNDFKHFSTISPFSFSSMALKGLKVDHAIIADTLCSCPTAEISTIFKLLNNALKEGGYLFVVAHPTKNQVPFKKPNGEVMLVENNVDFWRLLESYFAVSNTAVVPAHIDGEGKRIFRQYLVMKIFPVRERQITYGF